jgi:Mrp family chromosome partitioning ATPase
MAAKRASARARPNVLVTGTPGTGKTTTCALLADAAAVAHVNIGDLVRDKGLHDGWDEGLECHVINEDLVCLFPPSDPDMLVSDLSVGISDPTISSLDMSQDFFVFCTIM